MAERMVQISRRRQRRRRKNLTEAEKSELCQRCGRCCMAMTFEGGPYDEDAADQIRWMELHGLRVDYYRRRGAVTWYYTMPTPCSQLVEENGRYRCGIYETRPRMCRDYEGWVSGPEGVAECLWLEPEGE
jgi:Fe-S-cluster containining protein